MKEEHVYGLDSEPPRRNAKPIKYVITAAGCWECTSHMRNAGGYTSIRRKVDKGLYKGFLLHRLVFEKEVGAIPRGGVVLHSCDNPACFNPDHLRAGTHADNVADKVAKDRHYKGESHYRAALTAEDVRNIRLDTRASPVIGKEYGVASSAIRLIKNRKRWKHVE